jgi:phosphate transport system substrate-binding protein
MARIKQRQADFGASDVIAPKAALAKDGLVMFPTVVSGIVPVVDLRKGGAPLKLSGEVLARIFLGEITTGRPRDRGPQPGVSLPNEPIRVVCRSDGSGTTHFLRLPEQGQPGLEGALRRGQQAPVAGGLHRRQGQRGVSKPSAARRGAIGYIDYSYVVEDA